MVDDVLERIEWAEKRIRDFKSALVAFKKTNPYVVTSKRDANNRIIYFLSEVKEVPTGIRLLAGDVLQNLRTALDYLACELVRVNHGTVTSNTGFPIFDDPAKFQAGFQGKVKGMRQEAVDLIHSVKPYKTGDDVLWRLHTLNKHEKHRLLFAVGAACRAFNTSQHFKASSAAMRDSRDIRLNDVWVTLKNWTFPLKTGDILLTDPADSEVDQNIQFITDVALNERGVSEGEPLLLVLRSCANKVRRTVEKFSAFR